MAKKRKVGRPKKSETETESMVYLKCKKCKTIREIHTNDPSIYTDEVRENFLCIFCRHG